MSDLFNEMAGGPVSDGVWVTVSELARRKGITRQTAAERVGRLESEGRISTKRDGRSRMVELASFDRAVGQTGNAFREQGVETKREQADTSSPTPVNAALRDAQSERAQYEAKLKALDLAERQGALVPIKGPNGIEAGLVKATEAIVRELGAPLNWVNEIMETVREGEPALRRLLRKKISEQRQSISNRLARIAGEEANAERAGIAVDLDMGDSE